MSMQLDLNRLIENDKPEQHIQSVLEEATIKRKEHDEERKHRLETERHKMYRQTVTDGILLVASLIAMGVIIYICVTIIFDPMATPDDKKWSTSIISALATGITGYVLGKKGM